MTANLEQHHLAAARQRMADAKAKYTRAAQAAIVGDPDAAAKAAVALAEVQAAHSALLALVDTEQAAAG